MTYTAIFQSPNGEITSSRHIGSNNRGAAWNEIEELNRRLRRLIALVEGDHTVNTRNNLFANHE
tara:strand:+ start:2477 stop:2668 length:192 start_codon:yes stop_codon:yes gene_type:complete